MTDGLEALQWLTVDEPAAARRRAIKQLILLDRSAADFWETEAALQHARVDRARAGRASPAVTVVVRRQP